MVSFLSPGWLLSLLLTPAFVWLQYQKRQHGLVAPHLRRKNTRSRSSRIGTMVSIGWALAMIALAGPHWRQQDMPLSELARARVIVMDMSQAMYAEDILPNRFQQRFIR